MGIKACPFFTMRSLPTMAQNPIITLKTYIKTNHPNTWKFMSAMDKVLSDYDLELKRLDDGLEITRYPNLIDIVLFHKATIFPRLATKIVLVMYCSCTS